MIGVLTTPMKNALDAGMRQFTSSIYPGGFSQFVNDFLGALAAGNVGIAADAWDVDALALDGGHFAQDEDNTTGLDFAYFAGRVFNGRTIVDTAAATLALSNNATNYVEVTRAGAVSKNTVGFTAGQIPLYVIVTSSGEIVTVTNKKTLLSFPAEFSAQDSVATVSATGVAAKIVAPCTGVLSAWGAAVDTNITASDTDYWTFSIENKGPAGTGTTAMLAATDANTTKATGGSGLTANVLRAFTLHGSAANLNVTKGDRLILTATKTAAAANLVLPNVLVGFLANAA